MEYATNEEIKKINIKKGLKKYLFLKSENNNTKIKNKFKKIERTKKAFPSLSG